MFIRALSSILKPFFLFLFVTLFFSHKLFAQNKLQGIYLTANDFINNNITYSPIEARKYKFHLNEFTHNHFIKIIIGDTAYQFFKDSVFAFRDKEGICYRLNKRSDYQIISFNHTIVLYKQTTNGGYKNTETITKYYFSVNAKTPLFSLNKWNLKNEYPNNYEFHELLDMYFKSDDDLNNYDCYYHTYKLNIVLKKSIK